MPELEVSFSGRNFSAAEFELIRETVCDFSNLSLTELSKTICELLEWKRPTGKLEYEECRAFREYLRDQGVVILPGLRVTAAPGPRRVVSTSQSDAQAPVTVSAGDFDPLTLHLVQASNPTLNFLFKQYVKSKDPAVLELFRHCPHRSKQLGFPPMSPLPSTPACFWKSPEALNVTAICTACDPQPKEPTAP
jgi:hypothetical protein